MDISVILPNYNGEKLLQETLPKIVDAVKDYKGTIEIIIADDASSDNSVKVTKQFITTIKQKHLILKLVENHNRKEGGFSKNVNRGVHAATGEILVLLNTDVIPYKGFLEPLLSHFSDEKVFAVGCMDESIEDGKTVLRGRGVGKWEKGFLLHSAGTLDKKRTLWVSGGSGAFRKSMWEKLGGLNELYNPFYWEDIDISYRAQKMGFLTLFEKDSRVVHEHSKGIIKTTYQPNNVKKIVYRNQCIFVWTNITDFSLVLSHIVWLPYHLLNAVKSADAAFLVGFFMAFIKLPKILNYRWSMKELFRISDYEILQQFS